MITVYILIYSYKWDWCYFTITSSEFVISKCIFLAGISSSSLLDSIIRTRFLDVFCLNY